MKSITNNLDLSRRGFMTGAAGLTFSFALGGALLGRLTEVLAAESGAKHLLVLNKADLGVHESWQGRGGVAVSCLTGEGMEALADTVVQVLSGGAAFTGMEAAVNARHQACLARAAAALRAGVAQLDAAAAPEFVSMDLREALEALGEVAGRTDTEDLLGVIFSRFCIGK